LGVEWVWGLLQPGFVHASHDHFNHCRIPENISIAHL